MGKIYAIVTALFIFASAAFAAEDKDINSEICNRPEICRDQFRTFSLSNPGEISAYVNGEVTGAKPVTVDPDCLKKNLESLGNQNLELLSVTTSVTARRCDSPTDVANFTIFYREKASGFATQLGRIFALGTLQAEVHCALTTRNTTCHN